MRHQRRGDDEGRNIPGGAQVLLGADAEAPSDGVEQIRGAEEVEEPDQRQCRLPTAAQGDQRQDGQYGGRGSATTAGMRKTSPMCRNAWGRISGTSACSSGFAASQGAMYHLAISA